MEDITEKLKNILEAALRKFYEDESENLLLMKGIERSCVFRIGMYLQDLMWHDKNELYDKLHLDCEYNKHIRTTKKMNNKPIIPDLILHMRKTDEYNAMVIEFKGSWNKDVEKIENDKNKLKNFTSKDSENKYKYQLGVLVVLEQKYAKITYYVDGEEKETKQVPSINDI